MSASQQEITRLTISNNLDHLPLVMAFISHNAKLKGFDEKTTKEIELGVEEAVSNVIQHAFEPDESGEFSIVCEQLNTGLKVSIRDKGLPFDPAVLPKYNPDNLSLSENSEPQGLGWYLIQQSMDEVVFNNLGREGKEIQLIKRLPKGELLKKLEKESKEVEQITYLPKSIPFTIRKSKAEDIIEITKCAYNAYGYTYVFDHIYYPDRFASLMDEGEIYSMVAFTKEEKPKFMAHNALIFDNPEDKIATMGITFTHNNYQNQGCGKKLGLALIKEAIKRGMLGLTGSATTRHVFSQQGTYRAGVRTTAITIADMTASVKWKHFDSGNQRGTATQGYFNVPLTSVLRFKSTPKIVVPEHHKEMIEKIYQNLGRKYSYIKFEKRKYELKDEVSNMSIQTFTYANTAKIKVKSFGGNFIEELDRVRKRLCLDKIDAMYLYLNMADPYTAILTQDIESLGFFFSGIMPGPVTGDKLILQYLNNIKLDYDKIQLYSDFSKELLAYIKERDPYQD